jgi:hypothetical protein
MSEASAWLQQKEASSPIKAPNCNLNELHQQPKSVCPPPGRSKQRAADLLAAQPAHIRGVMKLDALMKSKKMRAQGDHKKKQQN